MKKLLFVITFLLLLASLPSAYQAAFGRDWVIAENHNAPPMMYNRRSGETYIYKNIPTSAYGQDHWRQVVYSSEGTAGEFVGSTVKNWKEKIRTHILK